MADNSTGNFFVFGVCTKQWGTTVWVLGKSIGITREDSSATNKVGGAGNAEVLSSSRKKKFAK